MKNLLTTNDYNSLETVDFTRVVYDKTDDLIYIQTPSLYNFVDLGLSVNWATCNVGASKPEEYGLYFAWGETEGYSGLTDTKKFKWTDYKFTIDASSSNFSKYNSTDGKTTLEQVDDAAYVSDNTLRMPTTVECQELISNTTSAWTSVNGVNGIQLISKKDTSKSIFIPAAGDVSNGSLNSVGSFGYIWSSSNISSGPRNANYMLFYSDSVYMFYNNRCFGYSVRPVKEKTE